MPSMRTLTVNGEDYTLLQSDMMLARWLMRYAPANVEALTVGNDYGCG